jgi:hypothetical protein
MTVTEKKNLLLELYTFDEILEIMGYYDGQGSTAWGDDMQARLEALEIADNTKTPEKFSDSFSEEFIDIVMGEAIINGNFEEALTLGKRLAV